METLKEMHYQNKLKEIGRSADFLHGEYQELLTYEVKLDEAAIDAETQLNNILNDVERRIDAARRNLSDANKIKDPAERKKIVGQMMGHLNRTRSLLDKVVKEFFPQKVDGGEATGSPQRDEMVSPQQAAETLGIPVNKLQNYVTQGDLRMYNDNGRWALKGSEVQALADRGLASNRPKPTAGDRNNRADFMQYVK